MKNFSELNDEYKNFALALGFFDGVHLGHKKVITSAVDFAKQNNTKSMVVTFLEHPQIVLQNYQPAYISTVNTRCEKLKELGVDFVLELDFAKISQLTADEYLKNILVKMFSPISISTGFNHYFGNGKTGTPETLENSAQIYNYKYFKIPPVEIDGEVVSSSLIRKTLMDGDIKKANAFLGYNFFVEGIVEKGEGLASKIGFKTANIKYPKNLVQLPFGVYSVVANGHKAIANFGVKPTFNNNKITPLLEVHILDFDQNIYNENLRVEFLAFIREERKFSNAQELIKQIKKDILNT